MDFLSGELCLFHSDCSTMNVHHAHIFLLTDDTFMMVNTVLLVMWPGNDQIAVLPPLIMVYHYRAQI